MLQGFADESEGKVIAVTGLVLPYEKWSEFSDAWMSACSEYPSIPSFHMRDARGLRGNFVGFDEDRRNRKLARLGAVITKHRPQVITSWLVRGDYEQIVSSHANIWEVNHAYVICAIGLVYAAAVCSSKRGDKMPIDFVFDEKKGLQELVLRFLPHAVAEAPPVLNGCFGSTPVFRNDEDLIPLQAADLVGWYVRRRLEIPGGDSETAPLHGLDYLDYLIWQTDAENLRYYAGLISELYGGNPLNVYMQMKPSKRRKEWAKLKQNPFKWAELMYKTKNWELDRKKAIKDGKTK